MELTSIPGFCTALRRAARVEENLRSRAFLPIGETINGVEVDHLCLWHVVVLSTIQSPFLFGGKRYPRDVAKFMWVVSGKYNPAGDGRAEYLKEITTRPNGLRFFRAIDRYVARALMDRPPSGGGGRLIGASFAASVIHKLAFVYGWTDDHILKMRVARIYQYLKWIEIEKNPKAAQFNPITDRVNRRVLRKNPATKNGSSNGQH